MPTMLLTCTGGALALETIAALRADAELRARVVGVDARPSVPARPALDAFAQVPAATDAPEAFVDALLRVCRTERVDLVLPGADEEALALAPRNKEFAEHGTTVAVQRPETLELMRDKAGLLARLRQAGVPVPDFALAERAADLSAVAEALGYPRRALIAKPRRGRGARGIVLLDPAAKGYAPPLGPRGHAVGDLASATARLREEGAKDLLVMEFLPGTIHDVDVIARRGDPALVLARRRLLEGPFSRGVEGHEVVRFPAMEERTRQVARVLALDHVVDLDFGVAADGAPGLLEVNPRWSGSVAAGRAAGVNVPALAARHSLGLPLPPVQPRFGARAVLVSRFLFEAPP